ncbi:peptide deformylase [Candidatus Riflebacteria bacterium]
MYEDLEIVFYGHPSLREECSEVQEFSQETERLIERMAFLMYRQRGVGLAAPQVGIKKNIILIDVGEDLFVLVNPQIIAVEGSQIGPEGCLSFPGLVAEIERPEYLKIGARNESGEYKEYDGEGLFARAVAHEVDHLTGKLFIDFLNESKKLIYSQDLKIFQEETMKRFGLKSAELVK